MEWANWLITRGFIKTQNVQYAIFAAEQVLSIFEKQYPNDNRPRKAIEAARNYLKIKNRAARAAANDKMIKILEYGMSLLKEK